MDKNTQLIIFDLDGTLIQNSLFYKTAYSASLTDLVKELKGDEGLKILAYCRKNYQGRGELSLSALRIPYEKWAEKLEKLSLDLIKKDFILVQKIKNLPAKKVVYTGSPLSMAKKLLIKTGFDLADFVEIIGWEKPEEFPIKWTCTPYVYKSLLTRFSVSARNACVIGNNYTTDLLPAEQIGIPTQNVTEKIFLIAGGNSTLLSEDCLRKDTVIKKSLGTVEQVGFINTKQAPKLIMMGNELCINATIAFASTLGEKGTMQTSGIENKVAFENKKGITSITIPLSYKKYNDIIILPGIGFSYSTNQQKITKKQLKGYCLEYNLPAFGSISYKNKQLSPIVYVMETDSFVRETACGSGSIALNILFGFEQIVQPTGKIITVKKTKLKFQISAEVEKISIL